MADGIPGTLAVTRGDLAEAELRIRLGALTRALRAAVARRDRLRSGLSRPELGPLAVIAQHADLLLTEAEAHARAGYARGPGAALDDTESARLAQVRERAADAGLQLPGDLLATFGLTDLDRQVLLLCAAPDLDPLYATLYGHLHDLRTPCAITPALAVDVLATTADHARLVAEACGHFGRLQSENWLVTSSSDSQLQPAPGVVELLRGSPIDAALITGHTSPDSPPGATGVPLPGGVPAQTVAALAEAFADGRLDAVGIWGPPAAGPSTVVGSLLGGRPVIRVEGEDVADGLEHALQRAALAGCPCVADLTAVQQAERPGSTALIAAVAATLARTRVPVVIMGPVPMRSAALMTRRRYAEICLSAAGFADRRAAWASAFGWLPPAVAEDLAARFRLPAPDVAAVAALDRAASGWAGPGHRPSLEHLAGLVSRGRSSWLAAVRSPERDRSALVLPDAELTQVIEVAEAARAWPRVADAWQLGRFGNPGVTALFAGDPGTGKTLAAEVIAAEIGVDLMVVDLSRLVSKWIGETEKHLDAVFGEAEAASCVLFFDEADSIFGQRGEVSRGADRYANLEVGYLLQRLESHQGVVILASNLRDNLDPAFSRRFHHIVHFPRPEPEQRRQLWRLALAPPVCTSAPVDADQLAVLDLTGAGIAAVVRGAALIAHAAGRDAIDHEDLLSAARRQFRREARLLPRELLTGATP